MSGRDLKSWIGRAEQKALLRALATERAGGEIPEYRGSACQPYLFDFERC
jgi:hypothetical protein